MYLTGGIPLLLERFFRIPPNDEMTEDDRFSLFITKQTSLMRGEFDEFYEKQMSRLTAKDERKARYVFLISAVDIHRPSETQILGGRGTLFDRQTPNSWRPHYHRHPILQLHSYRKHRLLYFRISPARWVEADVQGVQENGHRSVGEALEERN